MTNSIINQVHHQFVLSICHRRGGNVVRRAAIRGLVRYRSDVPAQAVADLIDSRFG